MSPEEKDARIAELEARVAELEKEREDHVSRRADYVGSVDSLLHTIELSVKDARKHLRDMERDT